VPGRERGDSTPRHRSQPSGELGTVAEQPDGVGSAVNVSGVNASTKAYDRSIRRPLVHSIRSTGSANCSALSIVVVSCDRPGRAMKTLHAAR